MNHSISHSRRIPHLLQTLRVPWGTNLNFVFVIFSSYTPNRDEINTQRIQKLERLIQSQGGLPKPSEQVISTFSPSSLAKPNSPNAKTNTSSVMKAKLDSKKTADLLSRKSQFSDLADEKINNDLNKKFEEICQREAKQEQLSQLHEIIVKVVQCRTCDYVDETPAPLCRQLGHDLRTNVCIHGVRSSV